jgi:hypothetical protein
MTTLRKEYADFTRRKFEEIQAFQDNNMHAGEMPITYLFADVPAEILDSSIELDNEHDMHRLNFYIAWSETFVIYFEIIDEEACLVYQCRNYSLDRPKNSKQALMDAMNAFSKENK